MFSLFIFIILAISWLPNVEAVYIGVFGTENTTEETLYDKYDYEVLIRIIVATGRKSSDWYVEDHPYVIINAVNSSGTTSSLFDESFGADAYKTYYRWLPKDQHLYVKVASGRTKHDMIVWQTNPLSCEVWIDYFFDETPPETPGLPIITNLGIGSKYNGVYYMNPGNNELELKWDAVKDIGTTYAGGTVTSGLKGYSIEAINAESVVDGIKVIENNATTGIVTGSITLPRQEVYQVRIKATDIAGWSSVGESIAVMMDATPPAMPEYIEATPCQDGFSNSTAVTWFWGESIDEIGVLKEYRVRIETADGEVVKDWTTVAPDTTSFTWDNLIDGETYVCQVKAVDYAGNESIVRTGGTITIDCSVPEVRLPDYPVSLEGTEAVFTWMPVNDGLKGSGIKEYEYAVTEGPGSPEAWESTTGTSVKFGEISADRDHYFWVRAVDRLDNKSANWTSYGPFPSFRVSGPEDGFHSNTLTHTFSVEKVHGIKGDALCFKVGYKRADTDNLYSDLVQERVTLELPTDGIWEWWLEVYESKDGVGIISESKQTTKKYRLNIDKTAPEGAFGVTSVEGVDLNEYTNNPDVILSNISLHDQLGTVRSGVKTIYLWNGTKRPTEFIRLYDSDLPTNITENVLQEVGSELKGVQIDFASAAEEKFVPKLPWRLAVGEDGERQINLEVQDLAGNMIEEAVSKVLKLDTKAPATPVFTSCGYTDLLLSFNWYLIDEENVYGERDLERFCLRFSDGTERIILPQKDEEVVHKYNGSYTLDTAPIGYNQPVVVQVCAEDKAGNKSRFVQHTGYTKAKVGEVVADSFREGYSEELQHFFTFETSGGIAAAEVLEVCTDSSFEEITVFTGEVGRFTATGLTPYPDGEYWYRVVALNADQIRTEGKVEYYKVPNYAPVKPDQTKMTPVGFAACDVKFVYEQKNVDCDGHPLTYEVYWAEGNNPSLADFSLAPGNQADGFTLSLEEKDHGKWYSWLVKVCDKYGACNQSDPVRFMLDAVPPALTLQIPNGLYTNQQELSFTASDELSGVQKIEYQMTDATTNIKGEVRVLPKEATGVPLVEGYYHLTVTVTDYAGNITTETVNNLRVDHNLPELSGITVDLATDGVAYYTAIPQAPVTWQATDDYAGIKGLWYWVRRDRNEPLGAGKYLPLCPKMESTASYALSLNLGNESGRYYLAMAVQDEAGNRSEITQIDQAIIFDRTPPEITFAVSGFTNYGSNYYLSSLEQLVQEECSAEDEESGIAQEEYILVDVGANLELKTATEWTEVLGTTLEPGRKYQINYRAGNRAGVIGEAKGPEFIYDYTPPYGLSVEVPDYQVVSGEKVRFHCHALDDESPITEYIISLSSGQEEVTAVGGSPEIWLEVPVVPDGVYEVTLEAKNAAGLCQKDSVGRVIINNHQEQVVVKDQGPYTMFQDKFSGSWRYTGVGQVKQAWYRLIEVNGLVETGVDWTETQDELIMLTGLQLTQGKTYQLEVKVQLTAGQILVGRSPGVTVDITKPEITKVETPSFTTSWNIWFRWDGADPESGIYQVEAALGTDFYRTDVTNGWVRINEFESKLICDADGNRLVLDLEETNRYYLTLRVTNGAGLTTEMAASSIVIDDTAPLLPVVMDQGSYINAEPEQPFEANWIWSPRDPESGNAKYEWAIITHGEKINQETVWRAGDDTKRVSLTMDEFARQHETTYYVAVKVTNGAGLSSIGYSDGIMVDKDAPFLTKVVLLDAANYNDPEAEEVNYISSNAGPSGQGLRLWIDSWEPTSEIDNYLYNWAELGLLDLEERYSSEEEIIKIEKIEIEEGVITVFLGETRNQAELVSDTGYSSGVVLDTKAPKITNLRGCFTGNRLLFDWEVEESVSPLVRYEYALLAENEYTQLIVDEDYEVLWSEAPDLSRRLSLDAAVIPDGRYYLVVRGFNAAGSYSRRQGEINEWGISPLVLVDRTAPVIKAEGFIVPRFVDDTLKASVEAEDELSGIHSYQYAVGEPVNPFAYSKGWVDLINDNGTIEIQIDTEKIPHHSGICLMVRVKDRVGLWSEALISPRIVVDHTEPTPPEVKCKVYATSLTEISDLQISSTDPESGITHYRIGIVKAESQGEWLFTKEGEIAGFTGKYDGLFLEEGAAYYLKAQTRNGAGTWSAVTTSPLIKVDSIAPEIEFALEGTMIVLNHPPIQVEYTLSEEATVWFNLVGADGSATTFTRDLPAGSHCFEFTEEKPQVYTLSIKATDQAGNTGEEKQQRIRVNTPPQVSLAEIKTTPGKPLHLAEMAVVYDPDGQAVHYSWDPGDGGAVITGENPEYRYTKLGEYKLTLTVTDNDGGVSVQETSVTVQNTTSGPLYMDEVWSGEHRLFGDVIVPAGIKLTILPGTNIIVDGDPVNGYYHGLFIDGSLLAEETVFSSVTNNIGGWKGIYITGEAILDKIHILQAFRGVTVMNQATVSILNSTIQENRVGLHVYNAMPLVQKSIFLNNLIYGIKEDEGGRPKVIKCVFTGNGLHYYHETLTAITIEQLNMINGNQGNRD